MDLVGFAGAGLVGSEAVVVLVGLEEEDTTPCSVDLCVSSVYNVAHILYSMIDIELSSKMLNTSPVTSAFRRITRRKSV